MSPLTNQRSVEQALADLRNINVYRRKRAIAAATRGWHLN